MKRLNLRKNATRWLGDRFARFGEFVIFVLLVPFILVGAAFPARRSAPRTKTALGPQALTQAKVRI